MRVGDLRVTFVDGTTAQYGTPGSQPRAHITIKSEKFWSRLARRGGRVGFGESYVAGEWDADDVVAALEILQFNSRVLREIQPFKAVGKFQAVRPHLPRRNKPERARKHISYHYDLGNDLFELFLDETMTYSSAYFERADATLADAQRAKYRIICEKLGIRPGDRVLEIGCGWGGFAEFAASEFGARVTGVTISEEQLAYGRERIRKAGLEERVDLRFQDYRTLEGSWPKIVSIEMFEAIGYREFATFFKTVDRLLSPDGMACIQTICTSDQRFNRYRRTNDWIREYIFPGGLLPSVTALSEHMTEHSWLMIHDLEEIGPHYAQTLWQWREAFAANEGHVRELGYDDNFIRSWTFYLAVCEAAFRIRAIRDIQIVLTRDFNSQIPNLVRTHSEVSLEVRTQLEPSQHLDLETN
jgi:cyclopropane-fatty-acyl-phospholipid synthase